MVICCKFKKESVQPLTLYTSFHDLINVYSRRSGADKPRGQNFELGGWDGQWCWVASSAGASCYFYI